MKHRFPRYLKWALLLFILAAGSSLPARAQVPDLPTDRKTGTRPLEDALIEYSTRMRVDLIYDPSIIAGKRTSAPTSGVTPGGTLDRLLAGTGLVYRRLPSGTYVIENARVEPPRPVYGSIRGRVVDGVSGEMLPYATIHFSGADVGAATNNQGFFLIRQLLPGTYRVSVRYIGYDVLTDTVRIRANEETAEQFELKPEPLPLRPVIIEDYQLQGARRWFVRFEEAPPPDEVTSLSSADAVRSLNQIIGVRVGDAMADVHIQGGDAGDHQFLLDGVPVFEPVHLRGLIGAFNPFAIEKIYVHKAGFGASLGSHLSGVIQAEHAVNNGEARQEVDVQVDPISVNGRLQWSAATGVIRSEYMLAGRTSIWNEYPPSLNAPLKDLLKDWNAPDAFVPTYSLIPILDRLGPEQAATYRKEVLESIKNYGSSNPDLNFNDLHGAGRIRIGNEHIVNASFYRGWNQINGNQVSLADTIEAEAPVQRDDEAASDSVVATRDDYSWVNANSQLRYEWIASPALLFSTRLRGSWYKLSHQYSSLGEKDSTWAPLPNGGRELVKYPKGLSPADDGNSITELAAEIALNYSSGNHHSLEIGTELSHTDYRFNVGDAIILPISVRSSGWRAAFYAEDRFSPFPRSEILAGSRFTTFTGSRHLYVEPRLEFSYFTPPSALGSVSFRLATGIYRQFVNQFSVSSMSPSALLPYIRFWIPVDSLITPAKSYHFAGQVQWNPAQDWSLMLEGYYKDQPRIWLIDYPSFWPSSDTTITEITDPSFLRKGRGYAYGSAVVASYSNHKARVSLRYEYTMARRTSTLLAYTRRLGPYMPDESTGDASRSAYRDDLLTVPWNEPHRVDLAVNWFPHPVFALTARWKGSWGQSWAFRQSYYDYLATDPDNLNPYYDPYDLSNPENHHLKPVIQLDLGTAISFDAGPTFFQLRFDVINVFDRSNEVDWTLSEVPDSSPTAFQTSARKLYPRMFSIALRLRV